MAATYGTCQFCGKQIREKKHSPFCGCTVASLQKRVRRLEKTNAVLLSACGAAMAFLLALRIDRRVNHLLPVLKEYTKVYGELSAAAATARGEGT